MGERMPSNVGFLRSKSMGAMTASSKSIIRLAREPPWLHVRGEPFEYGTLPIPSLMHSDVVTGLRTLRGKLLLQQAPAPISVWSLSNITNILGGAAAAAAAASTTKSAPVEGRRRVSSAGIAAALELSEDHAHLVLDTLASILNDEGTTVDRLATTPVAEIESVGADIDDLLLYLYLQTYRRVSSRPHRDASTVADVWPSTSAIDGILPSPTPLQARSAGVSRRLMPTQAEEEVHQLKYVRKHLQSLLTILSETTEEGSKIITAEQFERLGLFLRAKNARMESVPLSQATPFFANSDPDMPAAPVLLTQVLEWVQQHLCAASENLQETPLTRDEKPLARVSRLSPTRRISSGTADVTMTDVTTTSSVGVTLSNAQTILVPDGVLSLSKDWRPEGLVFVDGVIRTSVSKGESDIKGSSVKVSYCHDSVVYVLAPLKYASVFGCSDSIIVLGAVGKTVRVEHCERVQLIVPTARICVANCRESVFYLGVNQRPLFTGDSHNLQVAPYNTFYPKLESHLARVGVDATINRWDRVLTLGLVNLHDAFKHPAGAAATPAEGAVLLHTEKFTIFTIPRWSVTDSEWQPQTRANPFSLPKPYLLALEERNKASETLRQNLKNATLEDGKKSELMTAVHSHFREWLYASGNIRQLYHSQTQEQTQGME